MQRHRLLLQVRYHTMQDSLVAGFYRPWWHPATSPAQRAALPALPALTVVVAGVGQVRLQALDGALALHRGLGGEAQEGQHGEAPVLQLLQAGLVAAHAHGVKRHDGAQAGLQAGQGREGARREGRRGRDGSKGAESEGGEGRGAAGRE